LQHFKHRLFFLLAVCNGTGNLKLPHPSCHYSDSIKRCSENYTSL